MVQNRSNKSLHNRQQRRQQGGAGDGEGMSIEDAVISVEKIVRAKKKIVKNQIFNIVGENLKKSDLIKRI